VIQRLSGTPPILPPAAFRKSNWSDQSARPIPQNARPSPPGPGSQNPHRNPDPKSTVRHAPSGRLKRQL